MELDQYIARRRKNKSPLIMTHVVCGYPSFEDNLKELEVMSEFDVDFVELQFPFSEPSADGPLFVKANQISIQNGTTVERCFTFMEQVTARFGFKILMMGYYNTVFKMGHQQFVDRLSQAGACGYIIPDLPIEESSELTEMAMARGLTPVILMTPTNTDARLQQLAAQAQGMIYVVSRKGVTGGQTNMSEDVAEFLDRCRRYTDLPLGVGFGVSTAKDVAFIGAHADIAIIGTAALKAWEIEGESGLRGFFARLKLQTNITNN